MSYKKSILIIASLFIVSISTFAQNVPSAQTIITEAKAAASKENKQIFLSFHASWCGWCHRLDSLLTKTSFATTFNKHFVLAHITIMERDGIHKKDENAGGMELFQQYGGGPNTGIPYWIILDKDGKFLANSRLKSENEDLTGSNGDNTGCPGAPEEIAYLKMVLKKTAHFSVKEIAEVDNIFQK